MRFKAPLGKTTYQSLLGQGFHVLHKEALMIELQSGKHRIMFEDLGKRLCVGRARGAFMMDTSFFLKPCD